MQPTERRLLESDGEQVFEKNPPRMPCNTRLFGSCFAGLGGIDVALESSGLRCAWQIEIDDDCNRVLAHHWPDVPRYRDIREVKPDELPRVDVLAGGVPCQDWSMAGKRAGLVGERSGLFFEFARLADALAPDWVLFENVYGLLSSKQGEDFATVLETLTGFRPEVPEDGWRNSGVCVGWKRGSAWRVLDAQFFGVAQRRRRVFIVANPGDGRGPVQVLFEPESCNGDSPPSREAGARTSGAITIGAHPGGFNGRDAEVGNYAVVDSLTAHLSLAKARADSYSVMTLKAEGADASEDGTGRGVPLAVVPIDMRQGSRGEKMTNNRPGGSSGGAPGTGIGEAGDPAPTLADTHTPAVVYNPHRTLQPDGSVAEGFKLDAPKEGGHKKGGVVHGMVVRRLLPVECLRLQGLPDDWLDLDPPLSDSARYRLIGNSVATPVVAWICRRLIQVTGQGEQYEF